MDNILMKYGITLRILLPADWCSASSRRRSDVMWSTIVEEEIGLIKVVP